METNLWLKHVSRAHSQRTAQTHLLPAREEPSAGSRQHRARQAALPRGRAAASGRITGTGPGAPRRAAPFRPAPGRERRLRAVSGARLPPSGDGAPRDGRTPPPGSSRPRNRAARSSGITTDPSAFLPHPPWVQQHLSTGLARGAAVELRLWAVSCSPNLLSLHVVTKCCIFALKTSKKDALAGTDAQRKQLSTEVPHSIPGCCHLSESENEPKMLTSLKRVLMG